MGSRLAPAVVVALTLTAAPFATQVWAGGDPAKGEKGFAKCKTCHTLEEGKNRIGPSLYGIVGRQAGTVEGYKYSPSYVEAGKKGLKWDPDVLIAYLEDPSKYLANFLNQKRAKSKMQMKFKQLQLREDIVAYLQSLQ